MPPIKAWSVSGTLQKVGQAASADRAPLDYLMGCLSNDPWELARYAGVYKAVQSAGAAGSFGMDATAVSGLSATHAFSPQLTPDTRRQTPAPQRAPRLVAALCRFPSPHLYRAPVSQGNQRRGRAKGRGRRLVERRRHPKRPPSPRRFFVGNLFPA